MQCQIVLGQSAHGNSHRVRVQRRHVAAEEDGMLLLRHRPGYGGYIGGALRTSPIWHNNDGCGA